MKQVDVIDTGGANTLSMFTALMRIGLEPRFVEEVETLETSPRVVLPGVGTFAAALDSIRQRGWEQALQERFRGGKKTLAVCVGMQVLAEASEEDPGVRGLGILPLTVRRFDAGTRRPHMGWNRVDATELGAAEGHAYFAHSFRLVAAESDPLREAGWQRGVAHHEGKFVAVLRRGPVLACQFHPELSGAWGRELLRSWAESPVEEAASC